MNHQTFNNPEFRPQLNFFHSIHLDLQDTRVEKTPIVYMGTTQLVWMFRKASNVRF